MKNRFVEMDEYFQQISGKTSRTYNGQTGNDSSGSNGNGKKPASVLPSSQLSTWAEPFSTAQNRVLVVLLDNGGEDLGIPELVEKLMAAVPGSNLIPDSYRKQFVDYIRKKIRGFTGTLLESAELAANRYTAAKPDHYGDVVMLRDGTASYQAFKAQLIGLSRDGKFADVFILTHGGEDYISVAGGITGDNIRDIKKVYGKPLSIRSVYMMNCVGSTLNQAWLDAGAKVTSGTLKNNYLPEPSMFFFWNNWQDGQGFETAVTSAYRKTINLMNDAVRAFIRDLPIPGAEEIAAKFDFENMDFVHQSTPMIQGQRSITINSDALTFSQSISSSLATVVLPVSVLRRLSAAQTSPASRNQSYMISPQGIDFIKAREGFIPTKYNDPAGHCTIGYGTLLHTGNCDGRASEQSYNQGISEAEAAQLLIQKANDFQRTVNDSVSVALNQNQYDALVSFVYNVGSANFQNSTLLRLLNQGNYSAVPTEMKKWTKAHKNGVLVDVPGLVKRRALEADLFQTPVPTTAQSLARAAPGAYGQALSTIDYSIPGILPVIAQDKPNACWAAVFTMMYSWKMNSSYGIRDALARVNTKFLDIYDRDSGLDPDSATIFYNDVGLASIYSFSPTIPGWVSLLKKYGPLYVDVGFAAQRGTHAIIVTGLAGDGDPDTTSITYVDPAGGNTLTLKFRDFLAEYEAQSAVKWPYTIVHWPVGAQVIL